MEINEIIMYVVAGCTFITTVLLPLIARIIVRTQIKKLLKTDTEQTAKIESLRQEIKQLQKKLEEVKRGRR